MSYLKDEKNKVRTEYLERRNGIDEAYYAKISEIICGRIASLASYRYCDALLLYYPVKGELDVLPLAHRALSDGKKIAFPLCDVKSKTMSFHFTDDISSLSVRSFGIPEPPEDFPAYDKKGGVSALCIVPAVVFDKNGYRLGYGGGYYDRYLSDFGGTCIGALPSDFVVNRVPRSRYDAKIDVLVTEKGVISFYGC